MSVLHYAITVRKKMTSYQPTGIWSLMNANEISSLLWLIKSSSIDQCRHFTPPPTYWSLHTNCLANEFICLTSFAQREHKAYSTLIHLNPHEPSLFLQSKHDLSSCNFGACFICSDKQLGNNGSNQVSEFNMLNKITMITMPVKLQLLRFLQE